MCPEIRYQSSRTKKRTYSTMIPNSRATDLEINIHNFNHLVVFALIVSLVSAWRPFLWKGFNSSEVDL